jgi:hypothetical protein
MGLWRQIFSPPVDGCKDAVDCRTKAQTLGYRMFCWNGTIYATSSSSEPWNAHPLFEQDELR